eukprot:TRINITY_DN4319_c0_g1_i2.p1 TRINITY_DN4319_c0_g1~~TRINITY_DN4319_c0_g1_i2.p1  ORF type:complete len:223 (-),score=55.93 TRINITY_DN4319_c0_g1_i2:30-698(-)
MRAFHPSISGACGLLARQAYVRPSRCVPFVPSRRIGFLSSLLDIAAPTKEHMHQEDKVLPFSPEQVYDVVSRVDQYSSFLPWCRESTILSRQPYNPANSSSSIMEARLTIGAGPVEESYTSRVELKPSREVKVSVPSSPLFHHLTTAWHFRPGPRPGTCATHFTVSFRMKPSLHAVLMDSMFASAVHSMVKAFEARCNDVYRFSLSSTTSSPPSPSSSQKDH